MADTGIFATTAQVQSFVPAWASATYNTEAYINTFIAYWETYLCNLTGYDLSTNYAGLNAMMKKTLGIYVSLRCAINICDKDTTGADIRTAEFFYDSANEQIIKLEKIIEDKVNLIKSGV
ncbi:MAG: hypothetical protein WC479_09935 [Candidatus Izemoplasmatales bacterium]|jgi:hypothetical protein